MQIWERENSYLNKRSYHPNSRRTIYPSYNRIILKLKIISIKSYRDILKVI